MKKIFSIALGVIFAVCQAYAQENVDTLDLTPDNVSTAGLQELVSALNILKANMAQEKVVDEPITVPLMGKSKFTRSKYIYQTMEISTIMGKDADADASSGLTASDGDGQEFKADMNLGFNVGYTLTFVPGKIEQDRLRLNRFGFAYSTGLIASLDRQDKYDVTCDFLLKTGIETGNGRQLGIGLDVLFGGGRSPRMDFFFDQDNNAADDNAADDEDNLLYSTEWCWKYGFQLWIKTNLLQTAGKNSDVKLFARYIRSIDPHSSAEWMRMFESGTLMMFAEESWQFGLMVCRRF